MASIRARLFGILLGATVLVWLSAVVWIHATTRAEVERVLDARLAEAAQMVGSLLADQRIAVTDAGASALVSLGASPAASGADAAYRRQLSCQIWSLDGDLVGRSAAAPETPLGTHDGGFATTLIDDQLWRVYAVVDHDSGLRILVGDTLAVREGLVSDVIRGLLLPAVLILPVLAGLIWIGVGHGLRPLRALAAHLGQRPADDLRPLPDLGVASEIRPVVAALDGLFARVGDARRRERDFTAFAAHELKTPLAGIKTQAQIARAARDRETMAAALARIETGIGRTDRMVRQLLDLAAAEAEEAACAPALPVASVLEAALAELRPILSERALTVDVAEAQPVMSSPILQVALRNVLENAAQASSEGGRIEARIHLKGVTIRDSGPGIDPADLDRATEPFFRGRNPGHPGTGLGLAIAARIMARLGGHLRLKNAPEGGLVVHLDLPGQNGTGSAGQRRAKEFREGTSGRGI